MTFATREGRRFLVGLILVAVAVAAVLAGRRGIASSDAAEDGRVLIVEYSDYQCPACRTAQAPLNMLLKRYGDRVKWTHKHFPLERVHPWARAAALAAECAAREGRFQAYHDLLFERQPEWSASKDAPALFKGFAHELKLDETRFEACRKDPAVEERVNEDLREGLALRVQSTPTFFVAGERLAGSQQLALKGERLIDKALRERGLGSPGGGGSPAVPTSEGLQESRPRSGS